MPMYSIQFLGGGEPCFDGVERFFGHILEIVSVLRASGQSNDQLGLRRN